MSNNYIIKVTYQDGNIQEYKARSYYETHQGLTLHELYVGLQKITERRFIPYHSMKYYDITEY